MPRTHVMTEGESLQSVSTKNYGTPALWRVIDFANKGRDLYDKARDIRSGIEMYIPDPRFPLEITQRITGFPPETMENLRLFKKVGEEGLERHFKPSLGVLER
jgi:hypothetical protein